MSAECDKKAYRFETLLEIKSASGTGRMGEWTLHLISSLVVLTKL